MTITNWFTATDLKNEYSYAKVQDASNDFVNNTIIPSAQVFIQNFTGWTWTVPPDDIMLVAKSYAMMSILADDEVVKIAKARGQSSIEIAGGTLVLDLSPGKNPLLTYEDEITLQRWRDKVDKVLHVDKIHVKPEGNIYRDAIGRNESSGTDYIKPDLPPDYGGSLKP